MDKKLYLSVSVFQLIYFVELSMSAVWGIYSTCVNLLFILMESGSIEADSVLSLIKNGKREKEREREK